MGWGVYVIQTAAQRAVGWEAEWDFVRVQAKIFDGISIPLRVANFTESVEE